MGYEGKGHGNVLFFLFFPSPQDGKKQGGPAKGHSFFILLLSGILLFSVGHGRLSGTRSWQSNATISSPAAATAGGVALVCGKC